MSQTIGNNTFRWDNEGCLHVWDNENPAGEIIMTMKELKKLCEINLKNGGEK